MLLILNKKLHYIVVSYININVVSLDVLFFTVLNKGDKYYIHNHLSFVVNYHHDLQTDLARIVGFEVTPYRYNPPNFCKGFFQFNKADSLFCNTSGPFLYYSVLNMNMTNGMIKRPILPPAILMQNVSF